MLINIQVHKELYRSTYYKPSQFASPLANLIIIFGLLVFTAGVIYCVFWLDTPELWWGLLISLGALILFILLSLIMRASGKSSWLKRRQTALQRICDQYNPGYLKEKHVHVNVGPYGSYLKFIFTVRIYLKLKNLLFLAFCKSQSFR